MAKQVYASLDATGTQAAVYPSEEQLWAVGPTITDPVDPIVYVDEYTFSPASGPFANQQVEEAWLHLKINGPTSNAAYAENVIPTGVQEPTGFGAWNVQPFETGHSQNIVSNPSSEQGWGVGPARRGAHYPKSDGPNAARNLGQHLRNGELPWVTADSTLYERSQLAWEQQWDPFKFRSPVAPVVPLAPSVPFSQTVPAFAGGPQPYSGLDIPDFAQGVYN